jgi:Prolyl oligopeptidase family
MFGGSPWKREYAKAYEEQSAITYASAVTTPTLILHDTGDPRVPITSSYAMYHALKGNGVTPVSRRPSPRSPVRAMVLPGNPGQKSASGKLNLTTS